MASVALHTWIPEGPGDDAREGPPGDLGHSALQVGDLYVSFWPDMDSLVGHIIGFFHKRDDRNPATYVIECDPNGPYMRRPADFTDTIFDFEEEPMRRRWEELRSEPYEFGTRNCSHVCLEVLRAGLPPQQRAELSPDNVTLDDAEDSWAAARLVLAAPLTDCIPESLRALALKLPGAQPHPEQPPITVATKALE